MLDIIFSGFFTQPKKVKEMQYVINIVKLITDKNINLLDMKFKYGLIVKAKTEAKVMDMAGLIKILFKQMGKAVTFTSLNAYKIKEIKLVINVNAKKAFIPPIGTKIAIKMILKMPSKMLYFIEAICSPMAFKIPIQINCTYSMGHNKERIFKIGPTSVFL